MQSSSSSSQQQTQSTCATPASSNPPGGGGTFQQIAIDPAVYGTGNTTGWPVWGFSQQGTLNEPGDPSIFQVLPSILPRAWARWDTEGVQLSQYDTAFAAQAEAAGITFIGGTTATVLFQDEFPQPGQFNSVVSCDATGEPVTHPPLNFYRGSMASPTYRNYIIGIGEIQIDAGADGIHFDEPDESYEGVTYGNGDEGFDDANVADFGGFLCGKYPQLTPAEWQTQYGIIAADNLNCSLSSDQWGRGFLYRQYLARNGWQTDPLNPANPLAAEWGAIFGGHPAPWNGTFTGTYTSLVYWQDIVLTLRNYARQKYNKEIYITANGVYPFVDFQENGLTDGNGLGPNGTDADFCPLTSTGDFDGTQSLLQPFLVLKQESVVTDGRVIPVAAFQDGLGTVPGMMARYLSLPTTQRQDFWRMYVMEGLAAGVYFNMMLNDGVNDPTATQLDLVPLFEQMSTFLKVPSHASLFYEAQDLSGVVTASIGNVTTHLTQSNNGHVIATIAHLINHNYNQAFIEQDGVTVSFPMAAAPSSVTLISPDYAQDTSASFTYSGGQVTVTVPQLISYVGIIAQ